jgi:hypothetical protein
MRSEARPCACVLRGSRRFEFRHFKILESVTGNLEAGGSGARQSLTLSVKVHAAAAGINIASFICKPRIRFRLPNLLPAPDAPPPAREPRVAYFDVGGVRSARRNPRDRKAAV